MKINRKIPGFLLGAALVFAPALVSSQTTADQDAHSAKRDMQNAGHDTKDAARDTGHATKKETQKGWHKTKRGTHKAYNKTRNTTRGAVHGGEEGAHEPPQ